MMRAARRWAAAGAAAALLIEGALAGCSAHGAATAPDGAAHAAPLKPGVSALTLPGGRTATVHVPSHLAGPAPLVLVLHEIAGNGAVAAGYGFDPLVDADGFVAVYPDGIDGSWNAGGCCGDASDNGTDDVAFLTSVVKQVEARTAIDPKRVYATGFSNGAMMAYRLACETSLFAAIAPMSGDVVTDCTHPVPASVLHVHGMDDTDVVDRVGIDNPWRTADGCAPPTVAQSGQVHTSTAECADGRVVELVTIDGMSHQVSTAVNGYDAAARIWAFFEAHPGA